MAEQQRSLGFWRTWALSAGYMIGSGIFLMPTVLAPFGLLGLSSWLVTGAGAVLLALVLGSLSRRLPKIGGPYAYTRGAFGDFAGFLIAWSYWISLWIANAAIVVAMVGYLGVFFPALGENFSLSMVTGFGILAIIIALNITGVRQSGIFQLATTILKIIPLVAIGVIGLFFIEGGNIPAINPTGEPTLSVLAAASILTMWAFVGLEAATIPADDVVNPAKTIPRALIAAVLIVVAIYFLSSLAVMGIVDGATLSGSQAPFADAAIRIWGGWAGYGIALGAVISTLGALNCSVLLSGQMPMAAAIDGLFPKIFGKMSKSKTPAMALIIGGILSGALMVMNYTKGFVAAFTFMIILSTLAVVIPYAFCAMADLAFALRDKAVARGKLIRDGVISVLAFAFSIFLMVGSGEEAVFYGFLLLMAGVPFYVFVTRNKQLK